MCCTDLCKELVLRHLVTWDIQASSNDHFMKIAYKKQSTGVIMS